MVNPNTRNRSRRRALWFIPLLGTTRILGAIGEAKVPRNGVAKRLNPYTGNQNVITETRTLFTEAGCSSCHGMDGRGGIGLPLNDDKWKYGGDDETLFKLIAGQIEESRMPSFGEVLEEDQVWKILAYVWSLSQGEPHTRAW